MSYHFHTTHAYFLPSIADRGLLPGEHAHFDSPVVFFEPDYDGAAIYLEPKARMVRWPEGPSETTEDGECVRTIPVAPEDIEIELNPRKGDWMPLIKAMDGLERPNLQNYEMKYVDGCVDKILAFLATRKP
jgi:hypothetical protein